MLLVLIIEKFITSLQTFSMKKLALLLSLIVIFISVHAQAPVNDEPCGAINIPVLNADPISNVSCNIASISNLYTYSNATGSIGIPNPSCNYGGTPANIRDVWYKITVPGSGKFNICFLVAQVYNLTFYTGSTCSGTLTELSCYQGGGSSPCYQLTGLTAGSIIYLRGIDYANSVPNPNSSIYICANDYYSAIPVVDNNTKVGIGTTTPLAKLDVAGSGIFRDTVIFAKTIDLRNGLKMSAGAASGNVLTSDANGNASWGSLPVNANTWSINGVGINNTNLSGNVGIGTTTPLARLHVADSNVVFTATGDVPLILDKNPPVSGAGRRMMWFPERAAFRIGRVSGNRWDRDSIGLYSFAAGNNAMAAGHYSIAMGTNASTYGVYTTAIGVGTRASGFFSTAIGDGANASGIAAVALGGSTMALGDFSLSMGTKTTASGQYSTAMGDSTTASGGYTTALGDSTIASGYKSTAMGSHTKALFDYSTAIGANTTASGYASTAMGSSTTASGNWSTAMGYGTIASGYTSTSIGYITTASGTSSTSMGNGTIASGIYSTAMGVFTKAIGYSSISMGLGTKAKSNYSLAIGRYNDTTATNRLFEIGNGNQDIERANVLTVIDNGNVGIGTTNPIYKLHLGNTNNGLRIEGPATAASGGSALNIGGFGDIVIDKPGVVGGRLLINEVGDVGIGSATPSAYGHGGTNRILELRNYEPAGINIQSHLVLSSTANAGSMGGVTWASTSVSGEQRTGYIGTAFETANQTRLSFYTRSNAGILAERFYIQGNGNAWLQGTLTQNSDIRLKKNIVPLTFSLNKLTQLNGYTYNWISKDKDPNEQIGLIAQEVQKLYPQLVTEIKKENGETSLGINYIGLIPVMIESIKEQQKQIDELKLLVQKLLNK
jgi:hypothetical protein